MSTQFTGEFATLVPSNQLAKQLFSRCYTYVKDDDPFHLRFMVALPDEQTPLDDEPVESDTSYDSHHASDDEKALQIGAFILSLSGDRVPTHAPIGWKVGRGTTNLPNRNVDILLARPKDSLSKSLASVHFRLHINNQSGLLMISPGQDRKEVDLKLNIDGRWESLVPDRERVLYRQSSLLQVGLCKYEINYTTQDSRQKLITARNLFIKEFLDPETDIYLTTSYIAGDDITVRGKYLQMTTRGRGTFGWVYQGIDMQSGNLVAIKELQIKGAEGLQDIKNEVEIGKLFHDCPGLVPLLDSHCEHGKPDICARLEKYYLYFPYAFCELQTYFHHALNMSLNTTLKIMKQPLEGIRTMHEMGIMHRDIRPQNILVLSTDPIVSAICDYGKATREKDSVFTAIGPIHTLAPEVWTTTSDGPYTNLIDIWAYGYGMAELLVYRNHLGNKRITPERHKQILVVLDGFALRFPEYGDLVNLISSMLAWDPNERPTAAAALEHRCWKMEETVSNQNYSTGDKRRASGDHGKEA